MKYKAKITRPVITQNDFKFMTLRDRSSVEIATRNASVKTMVKMKTRVKPRRNHHVARGRYHCKGIANMIRSASHVKGYGNATHTKWAGGPKNQPSQVGKHGRKITISIRKAKIVTK